MIFRPTCLTLAVIGAAIAFISCSGGNNSSVSNVPQTARNSQAVKISSGMRSKISTGLPFKSFVDLRTYESMAELETVYPQLRKLTTYQIDAKYTPIGNPLTPKSFSEMTSNTTFPYHCGTGPYRPPAGIGAWSGNTPPNCTPTGVFAGVYSVPHKGAVGTYISALPDNQTSPGGTIVMPAGPNEPADAFIYIEGWEGPGAKDVEAGLAYQEGSDGYSPYIASITFAESASQSYSVQPNTSIYMRVGTDSSSSDMPTLGNPPPGSTCVGGCIHLTTLYVGGSCPGGTKCADDEFGLASNFTNNCCIFRRMTTIADSSGLYNFTGGYQFGPIQWAYPYTAVSVKGGFLPDGCTQVITTSTQTPCPTASFQEGGIQMYPQSSSYVQQENIKPNTGETDWVYFPS